jgi:pimeloyl-ACP methyl ester carboxylesterase
LARSIGFDHTYWSIGGSGSKYNYVEAALKAGHAILTYDRLGVGKSDKPNGIKEVQTPTQVEITTELVKYLRGKPNGQTFGRVIGIGHSFGRWV